ncbi:MAG: hypothetical protein IPK30_09385 [Cellvibrionales bacterium]|nr:hypothetical protein [Cellvibrionales bacterium]
MIFKTLGKILMVWFAMMSLLVIAALCIVMLVLIVRFKAVFCMALLFIALVCFFIQKTQIKIITKTPRYRKIITSTGEEVYVRMEDDDLHNGSVLS